jgi:hypothetical protein
MPLRKGINVYAERRAKTINALWVKESYFNAKTDDTYSYHFDLKKLGYMCFSNYFISSTVTD